MLDDAGKIEDAPLGEALSSRYLAYALSTITARSLPDVRDGLKPVHRRVLYAMHLLRLDPQSGFKKCARVVGDVIGKFHPHGDVAVYDAMVRLAQDFAQRYPLVEGSGNFGNIDGDHAAAMRYTESRLTAVARALLDGIDNDAVDFRPNYDGEETEPVVLPGAFPNLLANGSAGIAVGMATSIPPHNAAEICAAALHLIAHPDADTDALLAFVRGPDFPTGGVLVEDASVLRVAYETGRGSVRLRARWNIETTKGGAWTAVVTEIPYQVQKGKLIEQLAQLLEEKKLTLLADVRDESDALVRIVLEPRARTVDPQAMMEQMFRHSAMETRFPYNMNVLDAQRTPRLMGLRALLRAWLDHRQDVLLRESRHRATAVARRAEVLDGYLAVYLNLDEVIRIIRESDEPKPELMAAFTLSDPQAEAILNMRLRALRRLEEQVIRRERKTLAAEQKSLAALLANPEKQWTRIGEQVAAVRDGAGAGARRTDIAGPPADALPEEQFVEREPLTVILSAAAWVRCVRGHLTDGAELKFKEGDTLARLLTCQSTDRITAFASNGRAYTLRAADLPRGRGDGQPLRVLIELGDAEIAALFVTDDAQRYLVASDAGRGFLIGGAELAAEKRTGKTVLVTRPGESARFCVLAIGDHVACCGDNRKLLVFPLAQLPEMTRGQGVMLQRYKDGGLAFLRVIQLADGLSWPSGERTRTERDLTAWRGDRATAGRTVPTGWPRP